MERLEQGDPNAEELRQMNSYLMAELERARTVSTTGQTIAPERGAGAERPGDVHAASDGPLVKLARWLEGGLLRRRG